MCQLDNAAIKDNSDNLHLDHIVNTDNTGILCLIGNTYNTGNTDSTAIPLPRTQTTSTETIKQQRQNRQILQCIQFDIKSSFAILVKMNLANMENKSKDSR